jgi:ankyrin repeat protein
MCRMLISQGANVNYYVSETNNPLFNAVRFNREEICRLLLASGSSVNAIVYKSTMLNYAVRSGNENICKMLIEAGANLEGSPDSEFTPFCEAVHWDRISIVRLLASYGVDIYAKRRRAPFIDVMEIAACRNSQEMM